LFAAGPMIHRYIDPAVSREFEIEKNVTIHFPCLDL
jgi:hypothetical protein